MSVAENDGKNNVGSVPFFFNLDFNWVANFVIADLFSSYIEVRLLIIRTRSDLNQYELPECINYEVALISQLA